MSHVADSPARKPLLSNISYDRLKWLAVVGLPALGTLYFALAPFWDLPKAAEVVGTIMAVDAFLGLVLGVATKRYNESDAKYDGTLNIDAQDNRLVHQLDIAVPPELIGLKKDLTLKVTQVPPQ